MMIDINLWWELFNFLDLMISGQPGLSHILESGGTRELSLSYMFPGISPLSL